MSEQDPPGQQPSQQPPQQPYGQQGWGQPPPYGYPPQPPGGYPGFHPQGYGPPAPPKHPQAQTAMVLGIIALASAFVCCLPIFLSPFAWYLGAKAKREIAAEPGRWSGQGDAQAGFIMGIIGTALIGVAIVLLCLLALLLVLAASSDPSGY